MKNRTALLFREGEKRRVKQNQLFSPGERPHLSLVTSGCINLFIAEVKGEETFGHHHFLLQVHEGEVFSGMSFSSRGRKYCLLAKGYAEKGDEISYTTLSGDVLQRVSEDTVLREPLAFSLDMWVEKLSASFVDEPPPQKVSVLAYGEEIAVHEGETFRAAAKGSVAWVVLRTGELSLLGKEEFLLKEKASFFPFTDETWVTGKKKSAVRVIATRELLQETPFSVVWEDFHRFASGILLWRRESAERKEASRLQERVRNNALLMRHSLLRFASLLNPFAGGRGAVVSEDPLFKVCSRIGHALGVEVRAYPELLSRVAVENPLQKIADASRLRIRDVILRDGWWESDIAGPLLAYRGDERRPVAILQRGPKEYVLYNPETDCEETFKPEDASSLYGIAQSFYRPFPHKSLSGKDLLQFGLQGLRKDLWMVLFMGLMVGVLGMIVPLATGRIFDTIIPEASRNQLFQLTLVLLAFAFATTLFQITRSVALLRIEGKMNSSIQAAVWDRLLTLPVPFFREYSTGDLVDRAMGINAIRQLLSGVVVQSVLMLFSSFFNLLLLFYYSVKLALFALVLIVVALAVSLSLSYLTVRHQRKLARLGGEISGMVLQFVKGIAKIKVAGAESRFFNAWSVKFTKLRDVTFRAASLGNYLEVFNAVFPLIASMVLFSAFTFLNNGVQPHLQMTAGTFMAFFTAFNIFLVAMLGLTGAVAGALTIIPYYERAKPIFRTLPETDSAKEDPGELAGNIEIDHLFFRYSEDTDFVLKDISLSIRAGEYVAIVGASGSGKSTLLRLLLGFETPVKGTLYYENKDLKSLDVRAVRKQLGVVLQKSAVLAGDIFQNIVGALPLSHDDAWEAAALAGFDEDIKEMPMGMNTYLSDGGGTLSGGQRQRLVIARAVVHKPRILYFDEATSALDNRTQEIVSKSLENMHITRVVIAHRLSTIMHADRIIVLDKGRIVQEGNYDTLMQQEGLFAELARRQLA